MIDDNDDAELQISMFEAGDKCHCSAEACTFDHRTLTCSGPSVHQIDQYDDTGLVWCDTCHGLGSIEGPDADDVVEDEVLCPTCDGRGEHPAR